MSAPPLRSLAAGRKWLEFDGRACFNGEAVLGGRLLRGRRLAGRGFFIK
jgi:hypothetical protein